MSIFDRFKKTKKESEKKAKKEPKIEIKEPEKEKTIAKPQKMIEKKQFSEAFRILKSPHVTEKSARLAENNWYVFKVFPSVNKKEIKNAIQDLYGVAVEKVSIVNIPRKARRLGRSQGFKSGYKKAIVKLAEGEKIEIMPR